MQVYAINNIANGKVYVGQHSGEDLDWYLLRKVKAALKGTRGCAALYRAIRKYGAENFTIRCIHKCVDKAEMDKAEKTYIKFFGTRDPQLGYNLTDGGEGCEGYTHDAEARAKISASKIGKSLPKSQAMKDKLSKSKMGTKRKPFTAEWLENLRVSSTGKKHSEETKAKMRNNNLGKSLLESTKKKLSEVNLGKKRSEASKMKQIETWKRKRQEAEWKLNPMGSPAAA